ncbi:transglycosylase SLT domain-containing protein [Methylobacterium sp. Leaf93]|uniref:transglycosylase SLT domain-containing protein n=1 Tax=Methylobacterium sp. Leaf93 TaxID=1736249 RepID=UPI0009EC9930|nr:transglycosylase SLT domain-containing protein [Methylobacterium sp. Leaf93]
MMGLFPEPAHRADDACRLVPDETQDRDETVAWLKPGSLRGRKKASTTVSAKLTVAKIAIGLLLGSGLPQSALAPAATAHDRIDIRAYVASDFAAATIDKPTDWDGVPLLDQEPATASLIESDLASLPQSRESDGRDVLRFGDMNVPRDIVETILKASSETGVDPVYMMALADKESSFSTTVKASTSSAEGLFQFLSATWLELVRTYGARYGYETEANAITGRGSAITIQDEATRTRVLRLRQDPYVAALMAGELIKRDRARIEQRIGRELKTSELYLAHFLGTSSAGKFLTLSDDNPDLVAKQAFRAAARANRSLFTAKAGKHRRSLTVAEVRERLGDMIDRRLDQYEGVTALVGTQDVTPGTNSDPSQASALLDASLRVSAPTQRMQVTEALPRE